jgi:hypothetical protein
MTTKSRGAARTLFDGAQRGLPRFGVGGVGSLVQLMSSAMALKFGRVTQRNSGRGGFLSVYSETARRIVGCAKRDWVIDLYEAEGAGTGSGYEDATKAAEREMVLWMSEASCGAPGA